MTRIAVVCGLCLAFVASAEEKMSCGQMMKAQSAIPEKVSEVVSAVAVYFDASATDLASLKSKEAKAEAAELKKLAKMHKESATKIKAISTEMAKQDSLAAVPDHPAPSEKTKEAMQAMLDREKEAIALMQRDADNMEKMMKDSGAKAGGSR